MGSSRIWTRERGSEVDCAGEEVTRKPDEFDGLVWVVERDHQPLIRDGRVVCFPCGSKGTSAVRDFLNLPFFRGDTEHYYDAVLYENRAKKQGEN
jgi:hypothetical protein